MIQSLSNFSSFEMYLFAIPAIMLGSILFLGGIVLLLEPRNKSDAETLAEATSGEPPGKRSTVQGGGSGGRSLF